MYSQMNELSNDRVTRFHIRRDFLQLYHAGWRHQLLAKVTGRQHALLNLSDISAQSVVTRRHGGVQSVPIARIRGSEGRCNDFDANFRPLNQISQERWCSIAFACQREIPLPIVELVQVDDIYYVRDGHHRISVARWRGQKEIEATVTVWHSRPLAAQTQPQHPVSPAAQPIQRPGTRIANLITKTSEFISALLQKVQPATQRILPQGS
jgi:hypothetical protein